MNDDNTLFISVGGLVFRITLYTSVQFKDSPYVSSIMESMHSQFNNFLVAPTNRYNHTIQLVKQPPRLYTTRDSHTTYMVFSHTHKKRTRTYQHLSLSQFITLLHQIIQQELQSSKTGFYIHASAAALHDTCYLFIGNSGAGKTTISQLIQSPYSPLADDGMIIRKKHGEFYAYQTPNNEKFFIKKSSNKYKIAGIFILKKSLRDEIIHYNISSNIDKLIQQLILTDIDLNSMMPLLKEFVEYLRNKFGLIAFQKNSKNLHKLLRGWS